ncbi:hypothetical protein BVY04_01530 [bacterium M21]|nr:hypothetical protein BVY04_01530 [bacterium M21]
MNLRYRLSAILALAICWTTTALSAPTIVVEDFVSVEENGTASVTVSLDRYDTAVAVTLLDGAGDADLTVWPNSFTLSSGNPSQVLTVSAASDADSQNGTQTFRLSADNATGTVLTAKEIDNDAIQQAILPLLVIVTPGVVGEGMSNSSTVNVTLSNDPITPITLTITRTSGDADITAQSTMVLNAANWNASTNYLEITAAEDDSDIENDTAEFTITGADYAQTFSVTAIDDDILVTINVVGHGTVHGDGIQDLEDPLTITAVPHIGESFIEWAGPDADKVDDTGSLVTLVVAVDDVTIEARFTEKYDPDDDGCAMNSGGMINLLPNLLLIGGLLLFRRFMQPKQACD